MRVLWIVALFFVCSVLYGQQCEDAVIDQQHILNSADVKQLNNAIAPLVGHGAAAHVLTLDLGNFDSLDAAETDFEIQCHWSTNGRPNNNLLVFALDSRRHKSGIFYGGLWARALDNTWHDIATDYMNPHFKDHEWAAGLLEGVRQTRVLLTAHSSVATSKAAPVVVNEATDLTPLWHSLIWIAVFFLVCLLVWVGMKIWRKREQTKRDFDEAVLALQKAKANAAVDMDKAKQQIAEDGAAGRGTPESIVDRRQVLDQCYIEFDRTAKIEDDYHTAMYKLQMALEYKRIGARAQAAMMVGMQSPTTRVRSNPFQRPTKPTPQEYSNSTSIPAPAPANPAPAPVSNTTVIQEGDSGSGFLTGALFSEMLHGNSRRDDDEPRRESYSARSRDDDKPSYGGGGSTTTDDDDAGGGSTDWGSDDNSGGGGGSTDF
jgi:uncharacterized membrane protein YgcG